MLFGFLKGGFLSLTYDEFDHTPMRRLHRFAGFMEGIEERTRRDAERRKWKQGA